MDNFHDLLIAYTIMWLLHPSPRAKGNYASLMPNYAPSGCIMPPSGCLDLWSKASLWRHNATLSIGIVSIVPLGGVQ